MKRYRALAVAALCLVLGAVTVLYATKTKGDRAIGSFAVKIDLPDKHGSGAHIGRGYILTAAHVVEGVTDAKVITDTGAEYPAVVLWANKDYDVALLRVADHKAIAYYPLSCSPLRVGTDIRAYGNPGSVEFVSSHGSVVGKAGPRGPWKSVVTIDGTVVMGMSGGPIVSHSKVVGITVGVQTVSMAFFPAITGFGFAVPGRVICDLMGIA